MPRVDEDRIYAQIFEDDLAELQAWFDYEFQASQRAFLDDLRSLQQRKEKPDTQANVIEAPPPASLGSVHDGLDMLTGERAHYAPKVK